MKNKNKQKNEWYNENSSSYKLRKFIFLISTSLIWILSATEMIEFDFFFLSINPCCFQVQIRNIHIFLKSLPGNSEFYNKWYILIYMLVRYLKIMLKLWCREIFSLLNSSSFKILEELKKKCLYIYKVNATDNNLKTNIQKNKTCLHIWSCCRILNLTLYSIYWSRLDCFYFIFSATEHFKLGKICWIHLILYFILIYLVGFSGFLSWISFRDLGFILVSMSTSGLVFLFNGISTFVGYLMPKPFPEKNSSGTI